MGERPASIIKNILTSITNRIKNNMVFFGPGLLLAITAAGEAGITEAIEIGAHYGLLLVWAVIITLIFKYAFTKGIARYTLATGHTFFDALGTLPGPKNWGSYLLIVSYCMEAFAIGAMLLFAATFLDYIVPGSYSLILTAFFLLFLIMVLLRTHVLHYFEYIMAGATIILGVIIVSLLVNYPLSFVMLGNGLIPNIPHGSETAILAIIGVVGSGLNLMLYSVWLNEKTSRHGGAGADDKCIIQNETFFKKYIKSVSFDVLLGFIFVAVITIGFMFLGYAGFKVSFMPHGVELNLDIIISQIIYIFNSLPYGVYIFLTFVFVIFCGAVAIGLDARAKAISSVVAHINAEKKRFTYNPKSIYPFILFFLVMIMAISFFIGDPMHTIRSISSLCAILFGIFGFILIYLNFKLPQYARGSRLWIMTIGLGSALSLYVALLIESSFLAVGIPLIERMFVIVFVMIVFSKTKMFKNIISGNANLVDKIWTVVIFGILSIYGIYRGLSVDYGINILYDFADIAPAIAGLIGGPVIGVLAGVFGGLFKITTEGYLSLSMAISPVISGLFAGYAIRKWKGKITFQRILGLTLLTQGFNQVVVTGIMGLLKGASTLELSTVISATIIPTMAVNAIGLIMFAYIVKDMGDFIPNKSDTKKHWSHTKSRIKQLMRGGK